jgi:hypothetical protein
MVAGPENPRSSARWASVRPGMPSTGLGRPKSDLHVPPFDTAAELRPSPLHVGDGVRRPVGAATSPLDARSKEPSASRCSRSYLTAHPNVLHEQGPSSPRKRDVTAGEPAHDRSWVPAAGERSDGLDVIRMLAGSESRLTAKGSAARAGDTLICGAAWCR